MVQALGIINNIKTLRDNKIVLWGAGKVGKQVLYALEHIGVGIPAFCDNNEKLWGTEINGVPVISPEKLEKMVGEDVAMIVFIALALHDYRELFNQLVHLGVKNYVPHSELRILISLHKHISYTDGEVNEANALINEACGGAQLDMDLLDFDYALERKITFAHKIAKHKDFEPILICMPYETGAVNLRAMLSNNAEIYDFDACPQSVDKQILEYCGIKVKLVTAVRDPIAQTIAFVSKMMQHVGILEEACYLKLCKYYNLRNPTAQELFDVWMDFTGYMRSDDEKQTTKMMKIPRHIQGFIPDFCKHVVDILQEPFDKDRGFSVICGEHIDVFVYQYERQNDVLPELAGWLGVSVHEANKEVHENNDGLDIKFSGEYFDKCYSEAYVSHFYSSKDMARFRNTHRGNVLKLGRGVR